MVQECENESPSISRSFRRAVFIASGFSSHKCHCVSQQKAKGRPHTEEPRVCWNLGLLLGTDRQSFTFLLFLFIWVFVWNSVEIDEVMKQFLPKRRKTITKKAQRTRRIYIMYLTIYPSMHHFSVGGTGGCTVTGWKITFRVNSAGSRRRWDTGVKFSRKWLEEKKHFWRKSVKIQEEVQGYSSNDCA